QPRDRPDRGQHPADKGVHDLHRGDVDDHPVGAGGGQFVRQVFLELHDALVLQVDLDGDEERCPDLEDRHAVHQAGPGFWGSVRGWPRLCWPRLCWPMRWPRRFSTCASASASVALVAMSPNSMPSDTIVCATCGRMPL